MARNIKRDAHADADDKTISTAKGHVKKDVKKLEVLEHKKDKAGSLEAKTVAKTKLASMYKRDAKKEVKKSKKKMLKVQAQSKKEGKVIKKMEQGEKFAEEKAKAEQDNAK